MPQCSVFLLIISPMLGSPSCFFLPEHSGGNFAPLWGTDIHQDQILGLLLPPETAVFSGSKGRNPDATKRCPRLA